MTPSTLLICYLGVGVGAAVLVVWRRSQVGPLVGWRATPFVVLLWPFLGPLLFLAETGTLDLGVATGSRSRVLHQLRHAVHRSLTRARLGEASTRRALAAVDSLLQHLSCLDGLQAELDAELGGATAEVLPTLNGLREHREREFQRGLQLLGALQAKLTILYFSHQGERRGAANEREVVEELVAQLEALAELDAEAAPIPLHEAAPWAEQA
ncbi:MAG: hypothetical protein ABIJ09_11180 [Pseudomonadota bacterium]